MQKVRSELVERSFAHMYETGGMRRTHLRGRDNILKRLLIHAVGFNLALLVRTNHGIGKPRTLQGSSTAELIVQLAELTVRAMGAMQNKYRELSPNVTTQWPVTPIHLSGRCAHMSGPPDSRRSSATGC